MAQGLAGMDVDDALAVQDEEVPVQRLFDPARPVGRSGFRLLPRAGFPSLGHAEGSTQARPRHNVTKYWTNVGGTTEDRGTTDPAGVGPTGPRWRRTSHARPPRAGWPLSRGRSPAPRRCRG